MDLENPMGSRLVPRDHTAYAEVSTARKFLTAQWRKLIMANYAVPAEMLKKYVPAGTTIDHWRGTCYISLVGFMFLDTRLKGIPIPFHRNFEEVNLRFYVRHDDGDVVRRGVVFIKEIVPKPTISLVANSLYGERYETMRMNHQWKNTGAGKLQVEYRWKKRQWNTLSVVAETPSAPITDGSEAEFITEHYWGYTRIDAKKTSVYQVEHPRWEVYPVISHNVHVDFGRVYGEEFALLNALTPQSVFLAEGSDIIVRNTKKLIGS